MPASFLLGLALAVAAPAKGPPATDNPLAGEWVADKLTVGGTEAPAGKDELRFTFGPGGKMTVREGTKDPEVGVYKVDLKADPPHIDLIPPVGRKEPILYGVFKVAGDTLTIAVVGSEAARPTQVQSPAKSAVVLMTFKRARKD